MTEPALSTSSRLADRIDGHDNNFNLIRVTAALMVLVSHSFAVVTGAAEAEPLRVSHGVTGGSIAVDVFFIVSGLLVTRSIVKRNDAIAFARARALRIWPGLIVSLLLTAYVLGPLVTRLAPAAYLASPGALGYVLRGTVLAMNQVPSVLPGVFTQNPFRDTVNASLWTLPREVLMYVTLLAAWLATRLAGARSRHAFTLVVLLGFGYSAARHGLNWHGTIEDSNYRLWFMFFSGAAAAVCAPRLVVSPAIGALAVGVLAAGALLAGAWFYFAYTATLCYIVLCAAYLPGGAIRRYNAVGDYSYGLYIYAWPVQQAVIQALPGLSVGAHVLLSFAGALALGIASWHAVEKPAMALGRAGARRAKRALPATRQPEALP